MKNVNDKMDEVDQDPSPLLHSFHVMRGHATLTHALDHVLGYAPHVRV